MNDICMPAEWEEHQGVLMAWPHAATDWAYMLERVRTCVARIASAIAREERVLLVGPKQDKSSALDAGLDLEAVTYLPMETNDTWTRDYGPVSIVDSNGTAALIDFKFNGWGLKFPADRDNLVTSRLTTQYGVFDAPVVNRLSFVLEGGSIESDGRGTLMTTSRCLLEPNRNGGLNSDEIAHRLCRDLGARRVLWLAHGAVAGDDTDGHIDTLARFAPDDTIVYVGCDDIHDANYEPLSLMRRDLMAFRTLDGKPYRLVELPSPRPIFDDSGHQLPATYANFLITPKRVLMPTYGQPDRDDLAASLLAGAYPGRQVVGLDCLPLICQHGSLHCATMQLSHVAGRLLV